MQKPWSPVVWIGYAMCVGVMGTALASPLYPLYQQAWGLKPSDITHIFVVYMFGALASLMFLGRLTQRYGALSILRTGLVLMTAGVLLSALAWNTPVFMLARTMIGLASGMITTSASTGMVQASPGRDPRRTAALTSMAITLGFGLGPLVGGLIAQWAPWPLVTAYLPTAAMGLLAVYALHRLEGLPAPVQDTLPPGTWRGVIAQWMPRMTRPPRARRRQFWLASMGAFSAFGMFSLYSSLAPSFMREIVPWHGPAVSGLSIAMILFLSSAFQFLVRNWRTKRVVLTSGVALVLCNLLLVATTLTGHTAVFVAAVLMTAFGHGLASVAGMGVISKLTQPHERGGLLSSYLIVGYLGTIVPILGMGWLSDHLGLHRALLVFCGAMALLCATVTFLAARTEEILVPQQVP
ncbi:MFS transporter [Acidovorax sp. MR-S7]|uniref:MFS transporter n=1 Tax=Acidovorax sp. MR-S7 TaxID=1268622 RepID=UPI000377B7E2|nr:MFS transporter [Acidovorax sp. MR-S7]GAD21516.1 major facilitator superfamily MFS_1 [Acidovorax sp. MR-S7]